MRRTGHTWVLFMFALLLRSEVSQAAVTGWPEAVARLADAKSTAQFCVALFKGHGNVADTSRGRLLYDIAKADFDSVIASLITALAEGGTPESLPNLQVKLKRGTSRLARLCDLLGPVRYAGRSIGDLFRGPISALLKPLTDAVSALYSNYQRDDAPARLAIRSQLEAARWPGFDQVQAVR